MVFKSFGCEVMGKVKNSQSHITGKPGPKTACYFQVQQDPVWSSCPPSFLPSCSSSPPPQGTELSASPMLGKCSPTGYSRNSAWFLYWQAQCLVFIAFATHNTSRQEAGLCSEYTGISSNDSDPDQGALRGNFASAPECECIFV